jgi:hypothetical protein
MVSSSLKKTSSKKTSPPPAVAPAASRGVKFRKSTRKGKKYDAFYQGKWIPFGQIGYQHYRDSTGLKLYSRLDHMDKVRRANYLKRAKGIRNGKGLLTWKDPRSANYYAIRYLW